MHVKNSQIFLLIVAVALAGCVGQPGGGTNSGTAGVIITSFSPEVPEVEGDTEVSFFTIIKNVGDAPTETPIIQLFGLDDWTPINPSVTASLRIPSLRPADPARNLEGEESIAEFKLKAPTLKGASLTYTPMARIIYNYETKSTIQFKFATTELVRGGQQASTAQVTTTGGPFSIITRGSLPVISPANPKAIVQLEIQNVGGGTAVSNTPAGMVDSINIHTDIKPVGTEFSCDPATANIRLIGGKSRLFKCTITLPPSSIPRAGFATAVAEISLKYYYIVGTQTSIKVKGT